MHRRPELLQLASTGDASSSSTGLLFSFQRRGKDKTLGDVRLYYGDNYNNEMNIHDNFSYETLQETSVSYPPMEDLVAIVGSCNGLICLSKFHRGISDPIHICNPNTGEYVNLPEYTIHKGRCFAAFGFGYVHSVTNDQYKVVRIIYGGSYYYQKGEVQVYTIGSGSGWRTIEASWSRDFSIAYHSANEICYEFPAMPLLITIKNEVLFVHQGSTLHCYDPKTNTVKKLWGDDEKSQLWGITAVPHLNSFVSLKAEEKSDSKKKVIERSLEDTEY
ncbi:hypothetical protein MKW98_021525 [Papaver atlanticum]|uniref:F-box associated beta-propeller type 3 domain-containing protein n=1 Tax=Papaver atlanticum TaxID=357466 RepID=A0AAD4SS00_9MAGN|nr:hypothetical protein MKW98_021525 [Papaver atlanticum]